MLGAMCLSAFVVSARELKSFLGVNFGDVPHVDKFIGGIGGLYMFKPNRDFGTFSNGLVQVTKNSNRICTIWCDRDSGTKAMGRIATKGLRAKVVDKYASYGIYEFIRGSEEWLRCYNYRNNFEGAKVNDRFYYLFAFPDNGVWSQFMEIYCVEEKDGDSLVKIIAFDGKLARNDDAEGGVDEETAKGDDKANNIKDETPIVVSGYDKTRVEEAKIETVETPDSFLGFRFGGDIKDYSFVSRRDDGSALRCWEKPKKSFRKFHGSATLLGTIITRRIFSIEIDSESFPDDATDEEKLYEYNQTKEVIAKKYGVEPVTKKSSSFMGLWNEEISEYKVGDVVITLRWCNERKMELKAVNLELEQQAKDEWRKELSQSDGSEAL